MPNQSWNQDDSITIELSMVDEDGGLSPNNPVFNMTSDVSDDPVLQKLAPFLYRLGGYGELVIDFNSRGSHDPGSRGGFNDPGYPPEHDDERSLVSAYLVADGQQCPIPSDLASELFDCFSDDVNGKDLERYDPSGYDDEDRMLYHESIVKNIANVITEDPNTFNHPING